MAGRRLVIRASHIVAYQDGGHRYLDDGVVVVEGDTIAHVGRQFAGQADETLDATGKIVTPGLISCHAHLAGSSWANYPADDVAILAETGTSVAHAPWVFARRGIAMESFGKYLRAGVNMALGTDTCPQSMVEAMKFAAVVTKIMDRHTEYTSAADAFNAATLGGARALGRIAPGAKADPVIWDAETLSLAPVRDPVKNIVSNAQADDVETVLIDGRVVMRNRQIPGVDVRRLARDLQAAGERMWAAIRRVDRLGRDADGLSPKLYPPFRP